MPNGFGNIFAIPQVDTRGIAASVPKYNPMSGLAALIQAQNAVLRQARAAGGGGGALGPGQYKGVGDPRLGRWEMIPGSKAPEWIWGTTPAERAANKEARINEARAAIIQSDTDLQNQLRGLSEKSVPAQQEVLAAVRTNGTIARMAPKLRLSEDDTAKLLLDTPTQELAKRQRAIQEAGFFRQLGDAKDAILDKFSATVRAIGASAEERAALGQELKTKEEQRLQNNARADEFRRLEQEGRSTADYWVHNPLDTATMYAAPIAATVLPQIAGGIAGTMLGGPVGGLAGAVLGGGLSSAAYGGGEMLQRAATDPKLTTPEQRAQAADKAFAPGALISGAIGAIPVGPSSIATTLGRRAAAQAVRGLPEYAAAATKERAAMVAQEYARRRAEHGLARRIGSSYATAASDAAALGIAEQAGHNTAYGMATGQDIPITEGWAEQGLASAVLGLPFAAVMGRRARYLYPGGRYPTPEPGPVVHAEVLPPYELPPAAQMLGGTPPPTGPQGAGPSSGAMRATGGAQDAGSTSRQSSAASSGAQADTVADTTIAQMNEAIRRNPANMTALEQLDAEVSKQVSDVAATVRKAKSASTLEKRLTRQLEQQGVDPAVLERLAVSYPDTSWRKQTLVKVLDKHRAALPPAEVVALPPSVQDILGRESAELEAYRGNGAADATGRVNEPASDVAADGQLREGEADTANPPVDSAEPVNTETAAPAAADQPLAEARVRNPDAEGRRDAGAATPDTGTPEAVAAAPRGPEPGGASAVDGERSGSAAAPERATADTGKRSVESEAGAGPSSRGDGTDAGGADTLAVEKSWEQYVADNRKERLPSAYRDWVDRYVKPEAQILAPEGSFIKKNGVWYADIPGTNREHEGYFEKVPSVPEKIRDDDFFPWYRSQEGIEAMQQHLDELRRSETPSPAAESADIMKRGITHPTSEVDIKAALEANPESFSALRKVYPNADFQEGVYNATKLMAKAALGKPLTSKEAGKLKALKALGLHDMDVDALTVNDTVERAAEQGFLLSPEEAVAKNPTESMEKINSRPNCAV